VIDAQEGAQPRSRGSGLLSYEWVWGANLPAALRYRCEAAGCGGEVVVARAVGAGRLEAAGMPRYGDGAA
jgi:hypothetical protein